MPLINEEYIQNTLKSRPHLFVIVMSTFVLAVNLIHSTNPYHRLIWVSLYVVTMYFYTRTTYTDYLKTDKIEKRFKEIEKESVETQFIMKNNVNLTTSVKRTKHLRHHIELLELIDHLQRYERYDTGVFSAIVNILERFLACYAKILKGTAVCDNNLRHMMDLRSEMMNQLMFLLSFNVPQKEMAELQKISAGLHARTRRCMRIASRKCDSNGLYSFLDGIDCANAHDPGASVLEMY
jgi:hypothetical protein